MHNWFQVTPLVRENNRNKITEAENQSSSDDKDKLSKIITLVTTRGELNPHPCLLQRPCYYSCFSGALGAATCSGNFIGAPPTVVESVTRATGRPPAHTQVNNSSHPCKIINFS